MPTAHRRIDPRLLEILVCPMTKHPLRYDADRQELVSVAAGLAYPIRDGIPIMLVDEARAIGDGDDDASMQPPPHAEVEDDLSQQSGESR